VSEFRSRGSSLLCVSVKIAFELANILYIEAPRGGLTGAEAGVVLATR